jgi:predicted DNA binding protein
MKTNDMKTYLMAALMSGLLYAPLASAGENKAGATADRVSLFQVSLQCAAAPQIGCGSRAKPILLQLERDSSVSEAWLNRAGTRIAVVWKPGSNAEARSSVLAKLKEQDATEIRGKRRDEALEEFLSAKGWHRGAAVDRLSEEESGIIAERLVRRVEAKSTLAKDKAEGLQRALADALSTRLTEEKMSQKQEPLRLQEVAGAYLDEQQIAILKEAIEKGLRPLPNEK